MPMLQAINQAEVLKGSRFLSVNDQSSCLILTDSVLVCIRHNTIIILQVMTMRQEPDLGEVMWGIPRSARTDELTMCVASC